MYRLFDLATEAVAIRTASSLVGYKSSWQSLLILLEDWWILRALALNAGRT